MDAEGQSGVFGADAVPGAGGDGGEVGGDDGGGGGLPDARAVGVAVADALGDAVGEDGPVGGGGDGELEDGLEVGLVEGREDALDVVHEHLGVDVRLAVRGVGEAVEAFAGAGVAHAGGDAQLVGAFAEAGEGRRLSARASGSRGLPSSSAECSSSGFSSTKVSAAVRAVNRMTVVDAKVSSPPVRSRVTA